MTCLVYLVAGSITSTNWVNYDKLHMRYQVILPCKELKPVINFFKRKTDETQRRRFIHHLSEQKGTPQKTHRGVQGMQPQKAMQALSGLHSAVFISVPVNAMSIGQNTFFAFKIAFTLSFHSNEARHGIQKKNRMPDQTRYNILLPSVSFGICHGRNH